VTLTDRTVRRHNFELAWRAASIILIKTTQTVWSNKLVGCNAPNDGLVMLHQEVTQTYYTMSAATFSHAVLT